MPVRTDLLTLRTPGRGTHEITAQVEEALRRSGLREGTVTVFCQHTSCSPGFIHTLEGDDDMSSHIKMALTRSAEVLPYKDGRLLLGTWQGIFLWEHRLRPHQRRLVLTFHGE